MPERKNKERRRPDSSSAQEAVQRLGEFYQRNGFVRLQNPQRVAKHGPARYKKGDEVRLIANSKQELSMIRRLLREAGFKPGRPFAKGRQFGQPVYGREAVARFLELIGAQ